MSERQLNRPTADVARARGAAAYQAGNSQQSNPYKQGYVDRRPAKWWLEGWMKEATR